MVTQLKRDLQRISSQVNLAGQYNELIRWKAQWECCQYAPDSTYVDGLLQMGAVLHRRNELLPATQVVQKAIGFCEGRNVVTAADQPAKAYYRLGLLLSFQNRHPEAQQQLNQAVRKGQHIVSAAKWVSGAFVFLGFEANLSGDFQKAVQYAERGEVVARSIGDTLLIAKALLEKARALTRLSHYEAGRQVAEQAVLLTKDKKELRAVIATAYRALGTIADYQQKAAEALRYEQQAFEISRDSKDPYAPNYAVTLGMHFYNLHRYDKAATYFRYSIENSVNLYDKARALDNLGAVYWRKKQFTQALGYYQQGLTTMPIGFQDGIIERLPPMHVVQQTARKRYLLTLIQDKADTWLDYAKARNNKTLFLRNALETYQVADQIIDYMRWEHTGQESKLNWRQKTRGLYERAIETCYRLDDTEQAFRFMEKSRAVMLADKLNELGARQQLTPKQIGEEQKLQQAVNEQQSKLADNKLNSPAYADAQSELLTEQDKLGTFFKQLETTNPTYYRYKYDNKIPSLADLQHYLKEQHASFVTYFEGDSAIYVLGITGSKATLQRQPVGNYTRTVRQFMTLLNNPADMTRTDTVARFLTLGNELYQQLLAPLHIPAGRVIVTPDGSFIPFETLSRSATQPHYLVKDYAFSYEYSARLLLRKETTSTQTAGAGFVPGDFLGVAPVTFASALGQATLSGSDDALKPIAVRFGSSTLLTHEAATRRAFQAAVSAYRVIHLFTHATADSTGQEPTLYFADSTLRLSDLGDGALPNAQLVVLAACKTGIGAIQRGEGVFSLARGFSALGVPSVLTTLWSVQNDATYRLTDSFYSYLDQGLPKDVALQQAKRDWLATAEGANQLPNYWAGLILIGDTKPLDRPVRWPWVAGGMLLLLGTGATGLWWLRRRATPVVSSLRPA